MATKKLILCIEDDPDTASLIQEELLERSFDVQIAHDGKAGFDAILRYAPDLVLCDVNLPHWSGFEVLEQLTALAPKFGAMPFVFLTALADRDNELKGRRLGADDYIAKPIDFDLLVAIIQTRLSRVSRSAIWPDKVDLNQREIETLSWAARGKTSAEIAEILGLSKRTVDFHIDNAREKLGVPTRIQAAVKAATRGLIDT